MNITKAILIVVAISVALLAAWVMQRRPAPEQPVRQEIPDDPDGRVLKQLVAQGSDLSKPHSVQFFLYLPDQARATQACNALKAEGYECKVQEQPRGSQWQCLATRSLVPSHAEIVAISARMEELAKMHGGSYNGWVTAVVQ